MISKVTEQELDEAIRLAIQKAGLIDKTLQAFREEIMQSMSSLMRLGDNSRRNADPLGAYPDGITIMRINLEGLGFPNRFGTVITNKAITYGFQFFTPNTTRNETYPVLHIRSWSEAGTWTAWDIPETANGAQDKANQKVAKNGDTMTGALTLSGDPTGPLHAATKRYVDSLSQGMDITAGEGLIKTGSSLSIRDTGIAPGTYTKLTVNNKGQVTSASQMDEKDVPDLPASKISSGVLDIGRIPTGNTGSTVALGNHSHKDIEEKIAAIESDMPDIAYGMQGQIPFISKDNSNEMVMDSLIKEVVVVDNEADLSGAKQIFTSNADIFNNWERFSHGPNREGQPGVPAELTGWRYDTAGDLVIATINSTSHIGFVSDKRYDSYVHQVTLASDNADDDVIGVLLASAVDNNGKMHTLTALRNNAPTQGHTFIRSSESFVWAVVYNYQMPDARIVADGTSFLSKVSTTQWRNIPEGITLRIQRDGDRIECRTTEMNETIFNDEATLVVDLNSVADLRIFRGPQPYGYTSFSQPNSTYKNIYFSDAANVIYDIRNGEVWVANNEGEYVIDKSRTLADLGVGRVLSNETTGRLFFVRNSTEIVPIGKTTYRLNRELSAGQIETIDIHEVFGANVNARNIITQVTAKDTSLSSPTRGMFVNSEGVATVGKDDRYIVIINDYDSRLEFDILLSR